MPKLYTWQNIDHNCKPHGPVHIHCEVRDRIALMAALVFNLEEQTVEDAVELAEQIECEVIRRAGAEKTEVEKECAA